VAATNEGGLITPNTLKGFRDYPPELAIPRERLMEKARAVYRSFGFAPIDTPALEYLEVLTANVEPGAEIGKQLYSFTDQGGREVGLRFDLTVPFARFAAQHIHKLGTPFKRYHLGCVWRGESPQAGRYREFMQCDFDTIGTTSNAADIETALVIDALLRALGFTRFAIHINHRQLLNGVLAEMGLAERAKLVLRTLDKLGKLDTAGVIAELTSTDPRHAGLSREQAEQVVGLASLSGSNEDILNTISARHGANELVARGVSQLRELLAVTAEAGVPEGTIRIDPSICRGLDYYTGTVYETFLLDKREIGSVCSGGRYDNLAGRYTKQSLPGVGASLGLDRLLAAMEALGLLPKTATPAPVLIVQFDAAYLGQYQRLASQLRAGGIGVEVYPEARKLGVQLKYADARGFTLALIAGPDDFARGLVNIKVLAQQTQHAVALADLLPGVRAALQSAHPEECAHETPKPL